MNEDDNTVNFSKVETGGQVNPQSGNSDQEKHAARLADVLVVDDEPKVREAVRGILEKEGYSVVEAESASHVMRLLDERAWSWTPAAAIVDLVMPGSSGYDVIRRLSERYRYRKGDLPIIVISKMSTADDMVEAQHAGAHAFVRKPFKGETLLKAINDVIANLERDEDERKYTIMIY